MRIALALLAVWMAAVPAQAVPANRTFDVFCYHDVRDDVEDDIDIDPLATSTQRLTQHFAWLREHGYRPVSVGDVLAARAGTRELPPRAVLLTFDDGYASFFTRVYPLLKAFNYPAVLALVGSWLDVPADGMVEYGEERVPRSRFLSLAQIREMSASGLVEFASHSYALHRGVQGNPQGNQEPAAATRVYAPGSGAYEDAEAHRARLRADLARNSGFIEAATGKRPRVMVWPYGAYSRIGVQVAADLGMSLNFSLRDGVATLSALDAIPRHLMEGNTSLPALVWMLQRRPDRTPIRVAHVDLDYLYDEDAAQMGRNLDVLLERIKSLQINTVYLQAFADPDGDGTASAMYFPNRHLPVRADLFNRVAWQLKTRAGVRVYAWMPVLAYDPGGRPAPASLRVQSEPGDDSAANAYRRLSPFNLRARAMVREIYEDLAAHAHFDGVLYHDDALLSDHEDVNPAALQLYRDVWMLPGSTAAIRADADMARRWARLKTRYLIDFTRELTNAVRNMRPDIRTARNLYASVVTEPESEAWFAQNAEEFATAYDYVAVMAMPYMEAAPDAEEWLRTLAARIGPATRARTVFELQSRDWRTGAPVSSAALADHMWVLSEAGARHFGYYPDDFVGGHPDLNLIFPAMSLSDYPHRPEGTRDLSRLYSGVLTP